jgi:surface antigen
VKHNPALPGNCTWGAQEQWHKKTGRYLATAGDAKDWNSNAGGAWVSPVPHVNSIVVFEAYSSGSGAAGHVAWTTAVVPRGNGTFDVKVIEMNAFHGGGGFNKYNTWTYRHIPGQMSYIVAPG